jgi:hypothetical protein
LWLLSHSITELKPAINKQIYSDISNLCSDIIHEADMTPPRLTEVTSLYNLGKYIRPFQETPLPESTFQVDANIIIAKIAAPRGSVSAYQGEMPMPVETRARA